MKIIYLLLLTVICSCSNQKTINKEVLYSVGQIHFIKNSTNNTVVFKNTKKTLIEFGSSMSQFDIILTKSVATHMDFKKEKEVNKHIFKIAVPDGKIAFNYLKNDKHKNGVISICQSSLNNNCDNMTISEAELLIKKIRRI